MIAIIDYGIGNLRSVQNMLRRLGHHSTITGEEQEIRKATKLILPGVGHFKYGMEQLRKRNLVEVLNQRATIDKVPLLGISLGAQLLGRRSEEGEVDGLGWLPMDTKAFDRSKLRASDKLPHMGWADTEINDSSQLFHGLTEVPRYYYVHSYHMVCDDPEMEISHARFGYRFVSGVALDNIMGVQFHPEKSHRHGMALLRNFVKLY